MKKLVILFGVLVILFVGLSIWWNIAKLPAMPADKSEILFIVKPHENVRDIGYDLKQQGIIKSPIAFFLTIKQLGLDGKIQAGDFRLSPSEALTTIIQTLTHGTLDIWVTIPEGKRASEIAEILQKKLPSYTASWKDVLVLQEGYLFPDTYLFSRDADVSTVIHTMTNNFEAKYAKAATTQTNKLTKAQTVILASILEREGKSPSDMKMVASVLENRLAIGMPLQVDASIQYALGYQPAAQTWWKSSLSFDDLKIDSPYNTYITIGLPPTPISNPGLNALTAVLNPANTSYLYYISDANGTLHFARTLEEHNTNIQKFGQ